MSFLQDWKLALDNRRKIRKANLEKGNPDTVRDNLIRDFKNFMPDANKEELQELVEWAYHPKGSKNPSWGKTPYFRALLAISDQLYIYQEYLQEMESKLRADITSIVPAFSRAPPREVRSRLRPLHYELREEVALRKRLLDESPNKLAIFKLVDGERSITEIWRIFNQKERDPSNKSAWVSKQYISQVIKELEEAKLITAKRIGKEKVPYRLRNY